jgi:hypothetical protein
MGLICSGFNKGDKMKKSSLLTLGVLAIMGLGATWSGPAQAAEPVLSKAVFYVA